MFKNIYSLTIIVTISTLVLFFFSSLRFHLFGAGVDLGFFDQLLYLQSQGIEPISTITPGIHLIGDHFALILYPLVLLYKISPSVYWLLFIQALAFALSVIPVYFLAKLKGLPDLTCKTLSICYILYPAVFNINFYTEFRTEVIAIPFFVWAVYSLEKNNYKVVSICLFLILCCKEIMSLSTIAFGFLVLFYKKNYKYFYIYFSFSVAWFLFANYYIIPNYRGGSAAAGIWYFSSLGNSFSELLITLLTHPWIVIQRALLPDRIFYYVLLILPVILGLSYKKIMFFLPAIPPLILNILSDDNRVRDLIHHYSLPIIPFIFTWLIYSLSDIQMRKTRSWISPKILFLWSLIAFFALAKYGYFQSRYFPLMPYNNSVKDAMALVDSRGSVITSSYIANHLSHRSQIYLMQGESMLKRIEDLRPEYILISLKHLDHPITIEQASFIVSKLKQNNSYHLEYEDNEKNVFLFLLTKT
jgi:uncharacterized membrane protein